MNSIKYTKNNPLTLIFYGGNFLGCGISETILKESGNVLIVDDFSKKNSFFLGKLKEFKNRQFKGEIKSIDLNFSKEIDTLIPEVDFAIFIGNFNTENIDEFNVLKNLDIFFNITKKYNSKFAVLSNINKYEEDMFNEIETHIKGLAIKEISGKKGALIEIADVYGEHMDEYIKNPITDILQSIKDRKVIDVKDFSSFHYYIYIEDAINGIIKVLFSQKEGEYILSNKEDISNISLAFRVSDILKINVKNPTDQNIQREDRIKNITSNIEDWEAETPFEEGLKRTVLHKMAGVVSNVYNINKGFIVEKKEHAEKTEFKKTVDIKNFSNIKDKYLKNEYINKDIITPERKKQIFKRRIKKKLLKYTLLVILYILIIAPFILSFISYTNLTNNIKSEVEFTIKHNSSTNISSLNRKISNEINTLSEYTNLGYFILSPLSKYSPTKNILLSAQSFNSALSSINYDTNILQSFYLSSFNKPKLSILQKINLVEQSLNGSLQLNTVSLNINSKSILPSIKNVISSNFQTINSQNSNVLNSLNITSQMFSGKKYYTIIYLTTNSLSNVSGNIQNYSLVEMYNGAIDNVINSPNAGDLNQIQSNTNIPQTSDNISLKVNKAFNITNTGVIFITKDSINIFRKIIGNTPTVENYNLSSINKKLLIFKYISKYMGKNVIIYITDPKFQNINTLLTKQ